MRTLVAETPESARHPNPFLALDSDDLRLLGMTDDGNPPSQRR
jgi:hypothetical protein